ncbi:MAG: hypothetical protein P4L46_09340 [Fimbriimonas sp.]|nr:hypothetical protein [Fimbriimonas sp.]
MSINTGNGRYAIGGMIFGIGSIVLIYPWPFAVACSAVGLTLSLKGLHSPRRKMAIAGLVCSAMVLALTGAMAIDTLLTSGRCWCSLAFFDV